MIINESGVGTLIYAGSGSNSITNARTKERRSFPLIQFICILTHFHIASFACH